MTAIDRNSAVPYYAQLAEIIEGDIAEGRLAGGERIPSESELCRTYDLARSTVRAAFRILEQKQLIRLVPRRGAFVSHQNDNRWRLQVTQGFLETSSHSEGLLIATKVIDFSRQPLSDAAAQALGMPTGSKGFRLERLRSIDGQPAVHSVNWLPLAVGQALSGKPVLEGQASLNATLREAGHHIFQARREVAAVAAPAALAKLLEVPSGGAVLFVRSTSRDMDGGAFDYYESHVRTDMITISVDAQASLDA